VDKLDLILDPSHADFKQLESEITQYLLSLENVSYQQSKTAPPPGTLQPVDAETVRIAVELATAMIEFVTAIALIVSQVRASSPKSSGTSLRLRVKDLDLSLPASDTTIKKFLASLTQPQPPPHDQPSPSRKAAQAKSTRKRKPRASRRK
jgi:hypothetical protein